MIVMINKKTNEAEVCLKKHAAILVGVTPKTIGEWSKLNNGFKENDDYRMYLKPKKRGKRDK